MRDKSTKQIGDEAEDQAVKFLSDEGYKIQHRNWRYRRLEVDIIAEKDNVVAFVEVKYRSNVNYGHPADFVDDKKKKLLLQAAEHYCYEFDYFGEIQFDIISIQPSKTDRFPVIQHIPDAFYGIDE